MSKKPEYWDKAKRILSKRDKVIKKLIYNYKDGSLITRNDVFFSLCKSIIGQQISVAAANSVFLKFKKKCRNKITAKVVNKLSTSSLKKCGLSRQKVKGIKDNIDNNGINFLTYRSRVSRGGIVIRNELRTLVAYSFFSS